MQRINTKKKPSNDVVNHMNANFARETNQRDEDAEMQKFIEEQLKQRKANMAMVTSGHTADADEKNEIK
jgi:hypothetical protein